VADADLRLLYNAIDEDGTGVVALEDFARFAKKIRGRLFDVQVARPEPPAPATRESRVSASDRARAEAILCRLGEVVASRGGSSGFDDAHRGQGVSFARLFRVLDPESGAMDRADLIEAVKNCVEIKILRRVRAESPRRPPRHRRYTCSMAWRCRFLTARRSQDGRVITEK
jgi:hypothetical protein